MKIKIKYLQGHFVNHILIAILLLAFSQAKKEVLFQIRIIFYLPTISSINYGVMVHRLLTHNKIFSFKLKIYSQDEEEFLQNLFKQTFNPEYLQLEKQVSSGKLFLQVRQPVPRGFLIYKIPQHLIISPFIQYENRDSITKVIEFDYKLNQFQSKSLHMIFYILTKIHLERYNQEDTIQRYLLIQYNKFRQSLIWWSPDVIGQLSSNLYYFNQIWIDQMRQQSEQLINLTQEICSTLKTKYDIILPQQMSEDYEIRSVLSFIHANSYFINDQKWLKFQGEQNYPVVLPMYEFIRIGQTQRFQNLYRQCNLQKGGAAQYDMVYFTEEFVQHFSDCDFNQGDQYFLLDRISSSMEDFFNKGTVNEFLDYDLMIVNINEKPTKRESELFQQTGIMKQNHIYPTFNFDNVSYNDKFLLYLTIKLYLHSNIETDNNKVISEIMSGSIQSQKYLEKATLEYLLFFENLIVSQGKQRRIYHDYQDMINFKFRQFSNEEYMKKNVASIKFLQRRTIEAQIYIIIQQMITENVNFIHDLYDENLLVMQPPQ